MEYVCSYYEKPVKSEALMQISPEKIQAAAPFGTTACCSPQNNLLISAAYGIFSLAQSFFAKFSFFFIFPGSQLSCGSFSRPFPKTPAPLSVLLIK